MFVLSCPRVRGMRMAQVLQPTVCFNHPMITKALRTGITGK